VNAEGKQFWVKFHFKTESGIKNLSSEEADRLKSVDMDYAQRDLYNHIENGGIAAWKVHVQIMPFEDAWTYRFHPFDITKVWSHKDYPLIPFGRMVLNKNPTNYFAEVEQAAFSPSHLVPGIEPSPDKMLQGRLFSYPDTHRHRLGVNYQQIPINCPYRTKVNNYQRDGFMAVNDNGGSAPNYEPNSFNGPRAKPDAKEAPFELHGVANRYAYNHPNDDFVQAGTLYRVVYDEAERTRLVNNIVNAMKGVSREDIKVRAVRNFYLADPEYGTRIAVGLGIDINKIKNGKF
jgi:catalase